LTGHRPAVSPVDTTGLPSIDEFFSASRSLRDIKSGTGYDFCDRFIPWERPLFLPANRQAKTHKWFFARIGGHTQTYAFSPKDDLVKIGPAPRSQALRWLVESEFQAQEWSITHDATHARTKTFTRL
jgi:hypothetical protein